MSFASIETAVAAIAAGEAVIVVDDADRENEGDIIFAAQHASMELMGWTIRHSSGVVCVPVTAERADKLGLPPMTVQNQDPKGTAYTVSCDAAQGVSTGISAHDRANTARALAAPAAAASDFTRPGHIFPLRAAPGGVQERRGHTEAAVDLCRLAGCEPVGVIAEVIHDNGELMRLDALRKFAKEQECPVVSIADLVAYLDSTKDRGQEGSVPDDSGLGDCGLGGGVPDAEGAVTGGPIVTLPTPWGRFRAQAWAESNGQEHLAVSSPVMPARELLSPASGPAPLVRVHSECLTGDVFGSHRCDCGEQLALAMQRIALEPGAVLYVKGQEGRGIGLANKIRAYALQEQGLDTVEANQELGLPIDARSYRAAAQILQAMGLSRIRLLSNNPEKAARLTGAGIIVTEMVTTEVPSRQENLRYLQTKKDKMAHQLSLKGRTR